MKQGKQNALGRFSSSLTATTIVLLLATPTVTLAQIYAGANYSWLNSDDAEFTDDTANGWRAFFGGTANRIIGWEIGYADLGSYGGGTALGDVDITGWDASLLAGLPIGPVTLFGRLGAAWVDVKTTNSSSDSDWTYKYGIGADLNLGKKFAIRAEWNRYPIDIGALDANIDTTSLGFYFRFGP